MLTELLEKLNIKSPDQLQPAEMATYRAWAVILSKPSATIEDLKRILPQELERASIELRKFENSKEKDAFYKAYTSLCTFISKAISGPDKERENLKAMLKQKYGIE